MNLPRHTPTRILGSLLVLIWITLACTPVAAADAPSGSPEQAVRRAWEAARDVGTYRFASDVAQTTRPAPALSSVGQSSTRNQLHLEGDVDLPAHEFAMRFWTAGGSVANPDSATELRIQGQKAWTCQPGGSWQEVPNFSGGFAPNGDFLSYLAGIKNVKRDDVRRDDVSGQDADSRFTSHASRFTFDFDGPSFANYVRDQLESYLRERGELPQGIYLDSSATYRDTTGQGEITLDDRGLPRRLSIHLVYPPDSKNQRTEADFATLVRLRADRASCGERGAGRGARDPDERAAATTRERRSPSRHSSLRSSFLCAADHRRGPPLAPHLPRRGRGRDPLDGRDSAAPGPTGSGLFRAPGGQGKRLTE